MNLSFRRISATGAGIALASVLSAAACAQSQPAADSNSQPQQPQRKLQMVPAQVTLDHTLDAKKAKQGEPVTAKLQQNVQIPDAQALPRNTVLEGHVDQVQASENKGDSTMVVTFDKAKLKDGQELPIKATVIAVSQPASMQQSSAGAPGQPVSAGAPMSAPSGGGGGGPMGGGSSSGASSTPSQPMNLPQASPGSQQQAQQNGVPDVTLTSSIHDQSSATFTSKGRNVHVPDGTQMEVALTIIPAGVHLQ